MSALDAALLDEVGSELRAAARELIVPRFCGLDACEIDEKAPGELVTIVDREVEQRLSPLLARLLPGSRVVGEEAVAADRELLRGLDQGTVWLIDPLDGTSNFIAGTPTFASMIALLRDGETVAAWMLEPLTNLLYQAERGAGAYLESERLRAQTSDADAQHLRGAVLTKYMPEELASAIRPRLSRIGEVLPGTHCAGAEYPAIACGRQDFAVFFRTLPWDHAPGALFVSEAGGDARRYDGTPYRPGDGKVGLIVARSPGVWSEARRALFEDG